MRSLLSGFLIVLTSIFLAGCSNSFEEQKVLFAEVMVIHDEVMPEMQTINELSKALDSKLKEIQQDSVRIDEDMLRKISENKTALKEADDAMMSWMRDFADKMAPPGKEKYQPYLDKKEMTHEAYMEFLAAEKVKIADVKEAMLSSIENAKQLLEK
jgi:hypothetical protein